MVKARDIKFGMPIYRWAYKPKSSKVGQKGLGLGQMTYFYNFYIPHDIYGMDKDTNFKVGAWIGHKDYYPKIAKLAQADA